jgi:hypothetical protein
VVLCVIAASLLMAATTLTALAIAGDDGPEQCCPAVQSPVSGPSPTVRPSASRTINLPTCLIGSWRVANESNMVAFYTNESPIRLVSSGREYEFRPDGTGVIRHDNTAWIGSLRGNELRIVSNGTQDFTWTANDRTITYLAYTGGTLVDQNFDHRGLLSTTPFQPNAAANDVYDYTCQGTQASESRAATDYRAVWVRTTGLGVYG